ncbi:SDR family NAD(P)-dependent oxidoreductase [Ahrensia marina]|uniref:3-hydroxyacyl-CoA dehydrogenase n=1 Tax=Ahrensia marina TaxID=1514904 RepID=A0A0M9GNC6_9HYPH|nr:SDR family NAD(P)-dependent oxidoreductase [Ahrensia marina]KPB01840.1 3-hydroxyacyl-CoA dehydrogenase [Ahrensia marina]
MSDPSRHVVVTGGGSGVGAAIAECFSQAGFKVSIIGRRKEPLEKMGTKIGAAYAVADVTDRAAVDSALEELCAQNGPITIAIANAGAAVSKPFAAMSQADISNMLDVNVTGVFNIWQACLADMMQENWGRMLAVASTASLKGYPYVSGYCAAKHGVLGLTRAVSLELAKKNITVNAVCPGFVETPMLEASVENIIEKTGMSRQSAEDSLKAGNPMKRFIQPREVADTLLWLASAGAASVNGQAISVNGGEI